MRRPSYTELNYESPGSLGNSGLDTEHAAETEAGWRWGAVANPLLQAVAFRRLTWNTVDWVKRTPEETRWTAADLGRVETRGVELLGRLAATSHWRVETTYQWLEKEAEADPHAARYVLDYPRHRLSLRTEWQPLPSWRLRWEQAALRLEGTPARDAADAAAFPARVGLHWLPARPDGLHVSLVCENAWDDDTPRPIDLRQPERRLWLAAGWQWGG